MSRPAPERHGACYTRLYGIWKGMRARCGQRKRKSWKNYGGRGVSVCADWARSFSAFQHWAEGNGYSADLTLDRIDNDGNYEPGNCRWVTKADQALNLRRSKRAPDGTPWFLVARRNGINIGTFHYRLKIGWSPEVASSTRRSCRRLPPHLVGSDHPSAKLNEDQVRAIRASSLSLQACADEHGVGMTCISAIRTRRTWKHVA